MLLSSALSVRFSPSGKVWLANGKGAVKIESFLRGPMVQWSDLNSDFGRNLIGLRLRSEQTAVHLYSVYRDFDFLSSFTLTKKIGNIRTCPVHKFVKAWAHSKTALRSIRIAEVRVQFPVSPLWMFPNSVQK